MPYMNEPTKALGFRLPLSIIAEIEKEATKNDHSLNKVVVRMLQAQLEQEKKEQKKEVEA